MKTRKLYCVKYVERATLEDHESLKTHSRNKALEFAKYLTTQENILYSKLITYEYDELSEEYCFRSLNTF